MKLLTHHLVCLAVLFFVVANPETYRLVNSVLGGVVSVSDASGCATQVGVAVHAVVFALAVHLLCKAKMM